MLSMDQLLELVKPREPFTLYSDDCGVVHVNEWRHLYIPGFGEMGLYEGTDEGFAAYLHGAGWVYDDEDESIVAYMNASAKATDRAYSTTLAEMVANMVEK